MSASKFIPYGSQYIDQNDIDAVVDVLRSDYLTTGPAVARLEDAITSFGGSRHAVAMNSGTSALHAMYFAMGVGEGDEVLTTPLTFAATANAARYLGATPVFADVESDTGNIDPEAVRAAITPRTRLIVAVDYAGHPCDYERLLQVSEDSGVPLASDCAHSFGAKWQGQPVSSVAVASEISMHPVKPFTTAEGGAVLTDDDEIAERSSMFRTHGITRDSDRLTENHGPWYHEMQLLGFNYRITDLQAALGASQIQRLGCFLARRREIAARYYSAFRELGDLLTLPGCRDDIEHGWHLFVVRVARPELRLPFFEALRELNLGVQVHYLPVYLHPYYANLGYQKGLCPKAERFYETCVSLPVFPRMSDSDVEAVIERVQAAARRVLA